MRRRFTGYFVHEEQDTYLHLTIKALEDGLTVKLSKNSVSYRIDTGNWRTLSVDTETEAINAGQVIQFKGNLTPDNTGIGTFTISKKCDILGNCMSLLYGDNASNNTSVPAYAFKSLFKSCTTIVKVSKTFLPATTIGRNGYDSMFNGCTSLIAAPDLPAASMTYLCYTAMFYSCTSLVDAPALPAMTLYDSCYMSMFQGCINLLNAPELPATSLARYCYYSMFRGCTKLVNPPIMNATTVAEYSCYCMFHTCSSLIASPNLPATSLVGHCYDSMFYYCSKLLEIPNLPAKVLQAQCYQSMFYGCSKLNYIKMLATDISASNCLSNWVSGVASTGTFVKHKDMTSLPSGVSGIPSGWTVEDYTDSRIIQHLLKDQAVLDF
jgi:hypothetical protein